MVDIDKFLRYVKRQKFYSNQIVYIEEIPPKTAEFGLLDIPLHTSLMNWLLDNNYKLWIHQADAINAILSGKNVIVATSTSSGKSLCYNLPVLSSLLENKNATALYIFPRKALTQDQFIELRKLMLELGFDGESIGVYDGDTSSDQKGRIRQNANIIMTNPYALHLYLSHFQKLWRRFCKNLKYVIIDEVHLYKGIFGSNVAFLIRRLKRILEKYKVKPQWILSSATIYKPQAFAEMLVGEEFTLVDNDGSPSGAKKVVLWDLPYDDLHNKYRSSNSESRDLFKCHLKKEIQTLMFTKSRKLAEIQSSVAKKELFRIQNRIQSYRAGFNKKDRREIELGLKSRELLGVCSTNALELGIDIGTLEATITLGFPGTISSFRQQIGRSGRGEEHSVSTLVPFASPLDFFYIHNPDVLFGPIQEKLLLNLKNKYLLKRQIRCAAHEEPLSEEEYVKFGIQDKALFKECLEELVKKTFQESERESSTTYLSKKGNFYVSNEGFPPKSVRIDNLSDIRYEIYIKTEGGRLKYLTTEDKDYVYRDLHLGAIYYYKSEQFLVEKVDFDIKKVFLAEIETNYHTIAQYDTIIKQLKLLSQEQVGSEPTFEKFYGKVNVRQIFHSYTKINTITQEAFEASELTMPELSFNTESFWFLIPNPIKDIFKEKGLQFESSLHAITHVLNHMIPLLAQIDVYDIGGIYYLENTEYEQPTIYFYDMFKGGIGIAERIYEKFEDLLVKGYNLIKNCACTSRDGCPGCIMSSRCVELNENLDKEGALLLLELLIERFSGIDGVQTAGASPDHLSKENEDSKPKEQDKTQSSIPQSQVKKGDHVIVILELENDKYYVSETRNLKAFIARLERGEGARWTQIHKYKSVYRILKAGNLKTVTLETMKELGWRRVRGYA